MYKHLRIEALGTSIARLGIGPSISKSEGTRSIDKANVQSVDDALFCAWWRVFHSRSRHPPRGCDLYTLQHPSAAVAVHFFSKSDRPIVLEVMVRRLDVLDMYKCGRTLRYGDVLLISLYGRFYPCMKVLLYEYVCDAFEVMSG